MVILLDKLYDRLKLKDREQNCGSGTNESERIKLCVHDDGQGGSCPPLWTTEFSFPCECYIVVILSLSHWRTVFNPRANNLWVWKLLKTSSIYPTLQSVPFYYNHVDFEQKKSIKYTLNLKKKFNSKRKIIVVKWVFRDFCNH